MTDSDCWTERILSWDLPGLTNGVARKFGAQGPAPIFDILWRPIL